MSNVTFYSHKLCTVLVFSTLMLYLNCTKNEIAEIILPETEVITFSENWAVVQYDYLPLRKSADIYNEVSVLARKGDVFEIVGQTLETEFLYSEEHHWYELENLEYRAWAFGAGLLFFVTEEEASDASRRLE